MVFAHDAQMALNAAVALVNDDGEPTKDLASLGAFLTAYEFTGTLAGDLAELDSVRALVPTLRTLLTAPRDEAAELVNQLLAGADALPQLVRHSGWDWHLHAIDPGRPLADRIAVETAMAMVDVIRADEGSRLSTCAADDCNDVVLDLSRNRSRRFCSTTCGNRGAVAAYRARQRD